ncbi:MAG: PEP-utilizing enzyme [Acidimicrobiia bacterium]|nr:PEP-utilizing enzyme [Acidimicrobiia bacterium]
MHGVGIGSDPAVGPARVVRHPEDLAGLVDGDVLVTVATTTAFNAVFGLLSAVATEQGGLFSHAAILCRELGLPAVIGVAGLLDAVHDGDLVEVDPVAGRIRIVGAD